MIGDSESDIIAGQAYGVNTKYTNNLYNTIKEILE
jgi:phosphoglycolate phosphatase-like HAD superfamily hydrolase